MQCKLAGVIRQRWEKSKPFLGRFRFNQILSARYIYIYIYTDPYIPSYKYENKVPKEIGPIWTTLDNLHGRVGLIYISLPIYLSVTYIY